MKTRRSHDTLYLKENRYKKRKEVFKFIIKESFSIKDFDSKISVCDVGCAAGEFLYYINSLAPKIELTGFDVMQELIEKVDKVKSFEFNKFEIPIDLEKQKHYSLFINL